MKKISRIRWLTTLMGLVVLMFTCAGCGQTAAQSNVPKPDASQSRVRIYESMVELEDDSPDYYRRNIENFRDSGY